MNPCLGCCDCLNGKFAVTFIPCENKEHHCEMRDTLRNGFELLVRNTWNCLCTNGLHKTLDFSALAVEVPQSCTKPLMIQTGDKPLSEPLLTLMLDTIMLLGLNELSCCLFSINFSWMRSSDIQLWLGQTSSRNRPIKYHDKFKIIGTFVCSQ